MRAGEIFGMTWDRVNMKEGYFILTARGYQDRRGPPCLLQRGGEGDIGATRKGRGISPQFVFTYKGKPLKSIRIALASALEEGKIKDFRLHDLRHTYVTNARKAGVDRTVIMKLTGHKTRSMFTRYNTVDEADARQALKLMEGYFGKGCGQLLQ